MVSMLVAVVVLPACTAAKPDGVATVHGSPAPTAGALTDQEQAVQYTKCLRDHGVDVADPQDGRPPAIEKGTVPQDRLSAAIEACRQYQPTARATQLDPARLEQLRQLAKCMREHGFPSFPDPDPGSGGITIDDSTGIDPKSPVFKAAQQTCGMSSPRPAS